MLMNCRISSLLEATRFEEYFKVLVRNERNSDEMRGRLAQRGDVGRRYETYAFDGWGVLCVFY